MRPTIATAALCLGLYACASTHSDSGAPATRSQAAAHINLQLGVGYLQEGNLPIAKEKLDRAMSLNPHDPEIHGAMALLDQRLGKDKEADKEFRTALELGPHDPAMMNNYAVYLCSHNRADEGVRYFEQAAANPLYRTPWAAYTNAGVCLRTAHRDDEAAQRFGRALQSNPAYSEAVFQASDLDFGQQKLASARFRIDVFLLTNPATPDLLLLAYRIAQVQNDAAGQQKYETRLRNEFPDSDQAHALAASKIKSG
ncbi:MAG TPA: type IV pilus biogenesis/stability protein PilW [Steroidobacteraceae bacterium]|jgi:type IV pilus assembly protein PilF